MLFTVVIVVATCLPLSTLAAGSLDKDADPVPVVSSGSFTCDTWIHTSMDSFSVSGGELTGAGWSFSQGYVGYNLTGLFTPGETISLSITGTMGEMGYQMQHKDNDLYLHIKCFDASGKELNEFAELTQIDDSNSATLSDALSMTIPDGVEKIELLGSFTCSWRTPYSAAAEIVAVKVNLEAKPEAIPAAPEPSSDEPSEWTPPVYHRPPPVPGLTEGICKIGGLHGEVNVRQNDEDDDAYIFAWSGMELYHNDRVKTLTRSGCIISFADMSTFVMKEDTTIVLDIANERQSVHAMVAGNVWVNLKKMIQGGSMEVEMGQAIAGARGTTFICEEKDGVSTVKVFEGEVEVTAKATGKSVLISGGEMLSTDSAGKGTLTMFDMEAELAGWDTYVQQATAEAMEEAARKNDGFPVVIVVVLGVLLAVGVAAAVYIAARNKRKTAVNPTYGASVQGYGRQGPKFCANCGNRLGDNSKFCGKCGQRLP